ncbi:MAG TPA: Crp/Fnr family transcriptional regulator [Thermoleophilaceae bacterium]|nr:Crp/Fnr family transcriptional regulator [Thermoleophilaceae bacterium]
MVPRSVRFLEADPDLLEGLDETAAAEARSHTVAPRRRLDPGRWVPKGDEFGSASGFGLLVLGGFLTRRVSLGGRGCVELLGEGAVLHPWLDDGEFAVAPFEAYFSVLEPLELAVLDGRVAEVLCRWPPVVRNLMTRIMERSRHLAGHLTLTQFPRVETRLHVLLWHLAERFGRMTRDGVVLCAPLTHEVLGGMVAARRPSVTTALGRLEDQGLVVSRGRHEWLLRERPEELYGLTRPAAEPAT